MKPYYILPFSSVAVQGGIYKHLVQLLQTECHLMDFHQQTKGEKTLLIFVSTLSGDTVSMLTHTYPHTTPGED